jgi:hypothetical protein
VADAVLPYPHSRNDCHGCRERDADGEMRDGNPPGRPARLCRICIGNHIAWALVGIGEPVTVYPLTVDTRVYVSDLAGGTRG